MLWYNMVLGEGVAGILGIDDSKFQDVIDTMTEEEWEAAKEVIYENDTISRILILYTWQVDRERRLQDAIMEEQEARDKMEAGKITMKMHPHLWWCDIVFHSGTNDGSTSTGNSRETSDDVKKRVTKEFMMKEMSAATAPPSSTAISASEREEIASPEQVAINDATEDAV
jgi:hypothetical protein